MGQNPERPPRTTIYDVGKEAGVSAATVSRVLAGRPGVAEATKARVLEVANEMGYRPNSLARDLAKRRSDIVAVMIPDIANPFFGALVKGVQGAALEQGLVTLVCDTGGDPAQERIYLDGLVSRQVRHVFAVGLTLDRRSIRDYEIAGVSFIALDRPIQHAASVLVASNNRAGGRLAVRHLLELGHRRIAHICGPTALKQSRDRRNGYLDALSEAGIDADERLLVEADFTVEAGAEAYRELDRRRSGFTAIFAADDLIAIGVLSAAVAQDRRVPESLSIVGFDDVLLARYTTPALTTVRQDAVAMGARAVQIISATETQRSRKVVLPVSLVVRGSTGSPPNTSAATTRRKHGALDRRH